METLSAWWGRAVAVVMVLGFAALILLSVKAYDNAPPIPAKAVAPDEQVVYTADEISSGQTVFLKYGLMNNGTIWGHGGMLGPDYSAQTLHNLALFHAERIARERFDSAYASLNDGQGPHPDVMEHPIYSSRRSNFDVPPLAQV